MAKDAVQIKRELDDWQKKYDDLKPQYDRLIETRMQERAIKTLIEQVNAMERFISDMGEEPETKK